MCVLILGGDGLLGHQMLKPVGPGQHVRGTLRQQRHAAGLLPMLPSTASSLEKTFNADAARVKVISQVLDAMFTPPDWAATKNTVARNTLSPSSFGYTTRSRTPPEPR